jgi:hypothetical protein
MAVRWIWRITTLDDRRRQERWREGLLILTEASALLSEANSPPREQPLRQVRSDFQFAEDLERIRQDGPMVRQYQLHYTRRVAAFQETFERGGLRIGDNAEAAADSICASAIRDQLVAGLDDWALAAFFVNDQPFVKRLLAVARLADPESRWRDRFRNADNWRSMEQLLELADDAFNTSPPPSGYQLAQLAALLRQRWEGFTQATQWLSEACRRQPDYQECDRQ